MKSFFTNILKHMAVSAALLMLIVGPFQPLVAQAATFTAQQQQSYNDCLTNNAGDTTFCTQSVTNATVDSSGNTISSDPTAANPPAATPPSQAPPTNDIGCSFSNLIGGNTGGTFGICITNIVYVFTVGIGSGFAYVAAYFFDFAVQLSLNGAAYALTFVSTGWTTARDMANMAFLFILLYIAFKIMFEAETTNTIHTLVLVIVIALLVNFSFFFTRLAIDAGNILAIQFYNAIQAPALSSTAAANGIQASVASGVNSITGAGQTKDLTANIMGMLQLQNLFNTASFTTFFKSGNAGFMVTTIALSFLYIAAGIMFWLLTVAFAANGVKFLVRIVVLWFLIIASPLAFVCRAIPKFESYYDKWQSALINHAFYPVAFMFIFLILTNFSNQMAQNNGNGLINGIFNGLAQPGAVGNGSVVAAIGFAAANVFIRLGFVIAVLYIGLEASKKIGVMAADSANHFGSWVGGKYVGAVAGGIGLAGRYTLGAGARGLSNSAAFQRTVAAAERTNINKGLWTGIDRVLSGKDGKGGLRHASFDARNAPVLGDRLKDISAGKGAGVGGFAGGVKAKEEATQAKQKERAAIIRDAANREALKRIDADIKAGRPHSREDVDRVRNFNKREMNALKGKEIEAIAHVMSESQLKGELDNENRTDAEKESIRKIADPIVKAQKIVVEDLRKLNDHLTTTTSPVVAGATARGSTMNGASVATMRADLVGQMATLRTSLAAAPAGVMAEDIKSDMTQLRNAIKNLRELDRHIGRVQPHAWHGGGAEYTTY